MQGQQMYYYNNQRAYPNTPGYTPPAVPAYGPYPGIVIPNQNLPTQPRPVIVQQHIRDNSGNAAATACCAGMCAGISLAALCCCLQSTLRN